MLEKEREKALREKEKAEEAKRAKENAALMKPVQAQKVPFGVDPKTVYCAFHKAGFCEKGSKCKFSHDPNVGMKVEKKNLYVDAREEKMQGVITSFMKEVLPLIQLKLVADTMENWDETKLRSVVLSKHGNPRTTTDVRHLFYSIWFSLRIADCVQALHRSYRESEVRISSGSPMILN